MNCIKVWLKYLSGGSPCFKVVSSHAVASKYEMKLCKTCQRFDLQAFSRAGPYYREYDLGETVRAAQNDCSFCSLLVDNLLAVKAAILDC
jgi:hypothetical protein